MRILIGWDDPAEAELIALYLNANGDNEAVVAADVNGLLARANGESTWDVIMLTTTAPDSETAFQTFQKLRASQPGCPIVGACKTTDVYLLARFITNGLRSYVLRDVGGDFVFLLQSTLESTVQAVRAEREQRIAERMREEIESVRQFQESILPQELYTPPGYRIAACYEPSQIREMGGRPVILAGGDYYDVIALDRKSVVFIIGDAAGHGMRACMSIMALQTLMQMIHNKKYRKTATFVEEINRRFCSHSVCHREGSLVTLLYGILRFDRHELQWTSAGHPLPLLHDRQTGEVAPAAHNHIFGAPLGVDAAMRYHSFTTRLPPSSRLLLYTDGLVEAYADGETSRLFGVDGVAQSMRQSAELPAERALRALLDASHDFTRGSGRHDDTSALLLERA
ncbi:MAG: PP2C family protein-serine/threonine phosphatase [Planctomycetaceae bacterium]